jgi:hypothetical protein
MLADLQVSYASTTDLHPINIDQEKLTTACAD